MKFVSGVVLGIFVGALTVEILSRKYPGLLEKVERKGRDAADRTEDFIRRTMGRNAAAY